MVFLNRISMKSGPLPNGYPFTLPVIEAFAPIEFRSAVTFLVGENGSGKSTLLEAIAVGLKCPNVGAQDVEREAMLNEARKLAQHLTFSRRKHPRNKLFFRAEDAIGFTRRVSSELSELDEISEDFNKDLSGYGRTLAMGAVAGQRHALTSRYGENPDGKSHGEWFLEVMQSRIHRNGLYLLDEPETPLSPIRQLSLLSMIRSMAAQNCQFIIATHSPILMALPDAEILQFDNRITSVPWDQVEHVEITKAFLNDPASFLRHL
jgi:predicted ATPase